jgi:hypothetical protein
MRLCDTLRLSAMAALGLLLCGIEPAAAAQRGDQAQGKRGTAARSTGLLRPVIAPAHQLQRPRVERAAPLRTRLAVSRDSRAAYATSGCTRDRQGKCRSGRAIAMSWTQGLPPAANIQAHECPDGTMATLARGHENIVRCMPL